MLEYDDDQSLEQEEMSETECDRDCNGATRHRKCKLNFQFGIYFSIIHHNKLTAGCISTPTIDLTS